MNDRPPPLPPMSGETGNRILTGASAAASLIGIGALLAEILTEGALAEAVGSPVFLSAPLGLCALLLAVRVWHVLNRKDGTILLVASGVYWVIFAVGMMQ